MNVPAHINEKWIKASVLGTIWASSEIVLGSFLHNLRVPFSGNILTAIGIIILISAMYKWEESGLFWRAGIICALLKTMSPSAVIFGPMVAIFSEALLLELSVLLLGRTIPGFVLGAVLAMSWNLFQKIFNYIIFYGYNIVEVYSNLMQYAERQLGLHFNAVWAPLVLLLIIYALFGAFSAIIGIRTGKKIKENPNVKLSVQNNKNTIFQNKKQQAFKYSIPWLILNITLIIGTLLLVKKIPFGIWMVITFAIAVTWAIRYKRALRQLVRPKLWIFFIVITMVTAFVFTRLQSDTKTIFDAVLIGVEMNLRAIILIMGFSVLGTELYHPKIRNYFANGRFKQIPLALEISAESLPLMIANTPDLKTIIKNPLVFVQHILTFADMHLNEIKSKAAHSWKTIVITGEIGSGKTSLIQDLTAQLKSKNYSISGFYTSRIFDNNTTIGYNLVEVESKKETPFLSISPIENAEKVGKFFIHQEAIETGKKILQQNTAHFIVIDEIGKLELTDKGWGNELPALFSAPKNHFILSLRKEIYNELIEKYNIHSPIVFDLGKNDTEIIKNKFNNLFSIF